MNVWDFIEEEDEGGGSGDILKRYYSKSLWKKFSELSAEEFVKKSWEK